MKTLLKSWLVQALALVMATSVAFAQDRTPFRQEELDQMLAPVALYPDPLLSQILMASTYPLEVVQASRWSRANPGLKGEDAVRAAEQMDWDPSVRSLAAFPQVLAMMDENLGWMERLGEAFLGQQADVMDTVQGLRRRAEAAGNLRSSEQMQVARQGEVISIEPPTPEIVYVPYYNPVVVYGPWLWPAYPPVYWAPPRAYYPAYRSPFFWGSGITISANFFFGHADWNRRYVTVNRATGFNRPAAGTQAVWRHDPARRGVPSRNAGARQRFEQSRAAATPVNAGLAQRAATPPAADTRQRQQEERRTAVQERRDPTPARAVPNGNRPSFNRDAERSVPAMRTEVRSAQPETRSRPDGFSRSQQRDDRRVEQREVRRPSARSIEPRPAVTQPAPRVEARSTGNYERAARHSVTVLAPRPPHRRLRARFPARKTISGATIAGRGKEKVEPVGI